MTPTQPDFDFNACLKRISGDEREARVAFRALHDHFAPRIHATAKKVLRSREMADDLVQEVFTTIWVKRTQLSYVLDFEKYLIATTKLEALNLLRKAVNTEVIKRKHLEMMEAQGKLMPVEYSEKLDKIVELLPSPRRQIFILSKIQGMGGNAIADHLKISVDTVHWHVSQAMKFIKEKRHDVISVFLIGIAFIQRFTDFGQ